MALPENVRSRILEKAVLAPSGDNAQPWKFKIEESAISVLNVPEADTSLFNYNQVSNYIAVGAAIENMRLTAEQEGYPSTITFFPEQTNTTLVARLEFTPGVPSRNPLADAITERTSNRRIYSKKELTQDELEKILICAEGEESNLSVITDPHQVNHIGTLMSAGERITLENKDIHSFLFQHVTWTPEDDAARHGFYIKTFEFKPPQEAAFKLFSNWNILSFFRLFGVTKMIARDMANVYGSSAAFGALSLSTSSPEQYVRLGMVFERIWLMATHLGIAMQVTASIPLLSVALARGGAKGLSAQHAELVRERTGELKNAFSIAEEDELVIAWRLGFAEAPKARTSRAAPVIETI